VEKTTPQKTSVGGGRVKKKKCGGPQKVKILIAFFSKNSCSILIVNLVFVKTQKKEKKSLLNLA
jgi:hypothetical protein